MTAVSNYEERSLDIVTREAGTALSGTVDSRRVLNETGVTSAPTLATQGFSLDGIGRLYYKLKATTAAYTATFYEWDASSEEWAQNTLVGTVSVAAGAIVMGGIEVDGSHRGFWRITSGAGGTIEGWARGILRSPGD